MTETKPSALSLKMNEEYRETNENQNTVEKPLYNESIYQTPGVSSVPPTGYVTYVPYGFTPKTFAEKKAIRKAAMLIGIAFLIMLGITLVWGTAFFFVTGRMGINYETAYKTVSEPAAMQILQILLSSVMFTLPFIIIMRTGGMHISSLIPLGKPEKQTALPMFLFGISFCAFANIAVSQASSFFKGLGINYEVDFGENPTGVFGFLLSLIATAIIPALVEEFACRGIVLGVLRKFGDGFAVLVSAILFGAIHGNFEQMPFAFLVGLVLGYIVVKTGSLWIACAVHSFNNFISVFFDYALKNVSGTAQNIIYTVFLAVCMLAGIVAVALFSKHKNWFTFKKSTTESTFAQKMKWYFTSVPVIGVLIICFVQSLLYF